MEKARDVRGGERTRGTADTVCTARRCGERRAGEMPIYGALIPRCTCSNAKVISPVTCRSSVKYLMNPRPRRRRFYRRYPPGSGGNTPLRPFFRGDALLPLPSLPSLPPRRRRRMPRPRASKVPRPSIKSHSKGSCCNDIEDEGRREIRERDLIARGRDPKRRK